MRRDARAGVAVSLLLSLAGPCAAQTAWQPSPGHTQVPIWPGAVPDARPLAGPEVSGTVVDGVGSKRRSEEHTSELQSRLHLVCRLLLEKKKKKSREQHAGRCMHRYLEQV